MGNNMSRFLADLDKIAKFFTRVRSVVLIILLVAFGGSILRNGCTRAQFAELTRLTTGLNIENAALMDEVNARDSILIAKDEAIESLEAAIGRSEGRVNDLVDHYTRLYVRYEGLADSITKIPADSSYKYLNETAYNLPGKKTLPFSALQVNRIHLTYVEHTSLAGMHEALKQRVNEQNEQLLMKDTIIENRTLQVDELRKTQMQLETVVMNQIEQIDAQAAHIEQTKKSNRIWQIAGAAIILILAALAAGGG